VLTNLKNAFKLLVPAVAAAIFLPFVPNAIAAPKPPAPLRLVQRFKLPADVTGRFDHFGVDLQGDRLFLAAESIHQVLVLNLKTGTIIHGIRDVEIPHAIAFRQDGNIIYVTDGGAGALKIFDGKNYRLIKSIKLQVDADSLAYDQTMRYLYIVNGGEDAHQANSLVSVIDTNNNIKVGEVAIDSPHVEAMAVDTASSRLYVNNTGKNRVDVIDREKYRFVTGWPVTLCKQNVPAAIDEADNRLFIGCRNGEISVFDTQTGKEIQGLPIGKALMILPSIREISASTHPAAQEMVSFTFISKNLRIITNRSAKLPPSPARETQSTLSVCTSFTFPCLRAKARPPKCWSIAIGEFSTH
jgi:DNA-binding beta-propeller fold protein YncE